MKRFLEKLAGAIVLFVGAMFLLGGGVVLLVEPDEATLVFVLFCGVPGIVLSVVGFRLLRKRPAVAEEVVVVASSPSANMQPDSLLVDDEAWLPTEASESVAKDASHKAGYSCPGCGGSLSRKASVSPKGDTKCEYCDRWFNIHESSPPARSSQIQQSEAGKRTNLVHCRDCGHQISRKASVCPNCGAPQQVGPDPLAVLRKQERQQRALIAQQEREVTEQKRRENRDGAIGCGCITVIVVLFFMGVFGNNIEDPPNAVPVPVREPPVDKPGLILPGLVLTTLSDAGFAPGIWRESNSVDGGWCCSSLGNAIEFGPPGSGLIPLPSNLSLFVYGSGPQKLDRIVIKLNINNGETADEGKQRLWMATSALLKSLKAEAQEELESAISDAPVRFLDDAGDIGNERLWQSEIPNATAVLELEQTRLTALVFTIRANDASSMWD